MAYSKRRILTKQMAIFRRTGQVIYLYIRQDSTTPYQQPIPADIVQASIQPTTGNPGNTKIIAIFGKFEEDAIEDFTAVGRTREVTGIVTVPYIYKHLLSQADEIDPYGDGSRFKKDNYAVEEERTFITQHIRSITTPVDEAGK